MYTFLNRPQKKLKMRRLTERQLGTAKVELLNLLAPSHDPFSAVEYIIDTGPLSDLVKEHTAKTGRRVTLTPALNKLLALAIFENPAYNQMVFSSRVYQLEEIHIANLVLIPGTDTPTTVILENPHQKSLDGIQQELFSNISDTTAKWAGQKSGTLTERFTNFCYRTGAYRLIGQKRTFTIGYERGYITNHTLSNHVYDTTTNFFMRKDIITPLYIGNKFQISGPVREPSVQGDQVAVRDRIHLFTTTDHRIISGFTTHRFGQSLQRIAENPGKYL